ncbi:hypothetical protein [Cytobacillus firmus]|uniref:hypothetical protein n=1 Tax=Cytobacillus firmus TaxID=1399 RepID=UPI0018CD553D|nr:hypothetical protein [Cytobacillus firmus]MBG9654898.1 hypothetical protein [Cytobacillus firmus]MED1907119.1 hypothetical protein [Cytobacillus firmus]
MGPLYTVTLTVKEKDVNDLAATPKVTLVGQVEDLERNVRDKQDAVTAVAAQAGVDARTLANAITAVNQASDAELEAALSNAVLGLDLTDYLQLNSDQRVDMAGDFARGSYTTAQAIQTALDAQVETQALKEINWAATNGSWDGADEGVFTAAGVTGVTADNLEEVRQAVENAPKTGTGTVDGVADQPIHVLTKEEVQAIVTGINA